MKPINMFLDLCREIARTHMRRIARLINSASGGRITPASITLLAFLAHFLIAWLIAYQKNELAAVLLVIFGLFDALDGEVARLQDKASNAGMLLDATTDRMKEVILYCGAAFAFIASDKAYYAVWAVAACGASLCVSYVKAKGEMAVSDGKLSANEVNRLFQDGLLRYEVRMTVLVIGLLFNQLTIAVVVLALLAALTAFERLIKITRKLWAISK